MRSFLLLLLLSTAFTHAIRATPVKVLNTFIPALKLVQSEPSRIVTLTLVDVHGVERKAPSRIHKNQQAGKNAVHKFISTMVKDFDLKLPLEMEHYHYIGDYYPDPNGRGWVYFKIVGGEACSAECVGFTAKGYYRSGHDPLRLVYAAILKKRESTVPEREPPKVGFRDARFETIAFAPWKRQDVDHKNVPKVEYTGNRKKDFNLQQVATTKRPDVILETMEKMDDGALDQKLSTWLSNHQAEWAKIMTEFDQAFMVPPAVAP